jgi:hypothetical protein
MPYTDELRAAPLGPPSLIRRLRAILRAIAARIDLSHFPGSCCN